MNIEQTVIENFRKLPLEKQQEVLEFTESLQQKTSLPPSDPRLTPHEKAEKWRKFGESLPQESLNLPEEALHRDSMYED